jgi:hypothetical protein
MARRVVLSGLAAVALICGAVAGAQADRDAPSPSAKVALSRVCHPSGPGTLVAARVYIGARNGTRLQSARWNDQGSFAKVGLFVRKGETAQLSTDPTGRVRLIGWDSDDPQYTAVIDESTPHDGIPGLPTTGDCANDWNFYAGGFIFNGRHCAMLQVTVGDRTRDLHYGLRKHCDD